MKRVLLGFALLSLAGCANMTPAKRFHLSGFYVDAAMIHSSIGEFRSYETIESAQLIQRLPANGLDPSALSGQDFELHTKKIIERDAQNPYVRIAIGYDVQWSAKWSTRLDYSHESSIATGQDHGAERITLGMTWRPFAR
jgi:hypothetical protein